MARRVGSGEEALALDGKSSPKLRARRNQDISAEQIETFFTTLADTCNVVRSAKEARFTANWAYRKRKTDAAFRAGWARAVAEGYAKLELVLLDRAMNGTIKRVPSGSSEKRIREYPNQLAMALLKRHSETAGAIDNLLSEEEAAEIRERIIEKLAKKRSRQECTDDAEGDGQHEC